MKLAAIDIGTNSIHIVVVEATGRGSFEVIDREKRMVKLGAGLWTTHRLSERAFADGLEVLRRYYKLAESRGVDEILAVATSATREADNGTAFLDAIFRETGLMPRVISTFLVSMRGSTMISSPAASAAGVASLTRPSWRSTSTRALSAPWL